MADLYKDIKIGREPIYYNVGGTNGDKFVIDNVARSKPSHGVLSTFCLLNKTVYEDDTYDMIICVIGNFANSVIKFIIKYYVEIKQFTKNALTPIFFHELVVTLKQLSKDFSYSPEYSV